MLALDMIAGGVITLAILLVLFVGMRIAHRHMLEHEQTIDAHRRGNLDVVNVALVSQAELDLVWKYVQDNSRQLVAS